MYQLKQLLPLPDNMSWSFPFYFWGNRKHPEPVKSCSRRGGEEVEEEVEEGRGRNRKLSSLALEEEEGGGRRKGEVREGEAEEIRNIPNLSRLTLQGGGKKRMKGGVGGGGVRGRRGKRDGAEIGNLPPVESRVLGRKEEEKEGRSWRNSSR